MSLKDMLEGKRTDLGTIFEIVNIDNKISIAATGPTQMIFEGIAHYLKGTSEAIGIPVEAILMYLVDVVADADTSADQQTVIKLDHDLQ